MTTNKIIIILAFSIVIFISLLGVFLFLQGRGDKIELNSITGEKLKVNNFKQSSIVHDDGSVDVLSKIQQGSYSGISYDQQRNTFLLSLNAVDYIEFERLRVGLEDRLAEILGVEKDVLCNLSIEERNTPSPDPDLNGQVFGVSHCY